MGGRSAPPSGIFAIGGGEAAFQPADDEPGRGLAEEDLAGAHRGDDELVEGAHFPFPGTESPVTSRVATKVRRATMPGTMNQRDRRLGLNQARISSCAGGLPQPCSAAQCWSKAMRTLLT